MKCLRGVILFSAMIILTQAHAQRSIDTVLTIYFDTNVSEIDSSRVDDVRNFLSSVSSVAV